MNVDRLPPLSDDAAQPVPRYHGSCSQSSEQVRQDEAWWFGLHTVNPEVGTAGVVLVAPIQQLEVVGLRVERLSERERGRDTD